MDTDGLVWRVVCLVIAGFGMCLLAACVFERPSRARPRKR